MFICSIISAAACVWNKIFSFQNCREAIVQSQEKDVTQNVASQAIAQRIENEAEVRKQSFDRNLSHRAANKVQRGSAQDRVL